jgi:hypothetical protein
MFEEEKDSLLPYRAKVSDKPGTTYTKALTDVIVQKPVLIEYDQLIGMGVVA